MGKVWPLLKETYVEWDRHQAPKLGAGLSYYTVLSLAPLLIVVITVIGLVYGHKAASGEIMGQIQGMVGSEGAKAIQTVVANADKPKTGILASVLGLITLFLGASGVFIELRDALNTIWDVKAKASGGIWSTIRERFLSFGMVLAIGFLLLVSLALSAGIAAAGKFVGTALPIPPWIMQIVNVLFSLVVITVLFALIYRFLPDQRVAWRDVAIGAVVTSVLFSAGKLLIGLYIGKASVGSAYGATGSLVIVLAWIYYSAQIFFFGAEFTHVYSKRYGSHRDDPVPEAAAVATVPVAISTPPELRHPDAVPVPAQAATPANPAAAPAPANPAPAPVHVLERERDRPAVPPARMNPALNKAIRIAFVAALGGLGLWRVREAAKRLP